VWADLTARSAAVSGVAVFVGSSRRSRAISSQSKFVARDRTPPILQQPTTVTVTISAEATWHRLTGVGADAVQVGQCATVIGRPASDPTPAGVSISLRQAESTGCRRGGGGPHLGGGPCAGAPDLAGRSGDGS
jgi:hypothetical protein